LKCEECGSIENLQKHHVSYDPEEIQILCNVCHFNFHGHGVGKPSGYGKHYNVVSSCVPSKLKGIIRECIEQSVYVNESEFIREAIREKILLDAPHLIRISE